MEVSPEDENHDLREREFDDQSLPEDDLPIDDGDDQQLVGEALDGLPRVDDAIVMDPVEGGGNGVAQDENLQQPPDPRRDGSESSSSTGMPPLEQADGTPFVHVTPPNQNQER